MTSVKSKIIKYLVYIIVGVTLSYLGSHSIFVSYTTDPNAPPLEYILEDAIILAWGSGILIFCLLMLSLWLFDTFLIQKQFNKAEKKTTKFTIYGALIGAIFGIFGGIFFGAIPALTIFGFQYFDPGQFLVTFGFAGLHSVTFAILPGAVGGAYLARWLEKAERSPRDVTFHSLLIGSLAGLVAVLAFISIFLRFSVDWMSAIFALAAIAVAAGSSLLAAKFLAKKKSKFV